jgi:uncharacterized tellurite resistance protein B-like protein
MSKVPGNILHSAVQDIFQNNEKLLPKEHRSNKLSAKTPKKDLELAMTVLLVDLAACDQHFDIQEYNIIQNGLRRVFGTSKAEVTALINQANQTLKNLRGSGRFASMLKENLDQTQRAAVMEVIEDVISADGVEDGFEIYLRHKFADLLGIPLKQPEAEKPAS